MFDISLSLKRLLPGAPPHTALWSHWATLLIRPQGRGRTPDFRVVMTLASYGVLCDTSVPSYPRWADANPLDLVARALAVCLYGEEKVRPQEPPSHIGSVRGARLTVSRASPPSVLSSRWVCELMTTPKLTGRGIYQSVYEGLAPAEEVTLVHYAPRLFDPFELALYACCAMLNGDDVPIERNRCLPNRPMSARMPRALPDGRVALDDLPRPVAAEFRDWLAFQRIEMPYSAQWPAVRYELYEDFLDGITARDPGDES